MQARIYFFPDRCDADLSPELARSNAMKDGGHDADVYPLAKLVMAMEHGAAEAKFVRAIVKRRWK
jgi:hypothetical protein